MTSAVPSPAADPSPGHEVVRSIATLARLHVDAGDLDHLVDHFRRVAEFVATLERVDVTDIEPELHDPRGSESMRADLERSARQPGGPLPRERVLENAPDREGPYFVTPRVV